MLNSSLSHSYVYYNKFRQEYISKLIKFVNRKKLNKCFFASAGTESTEVALKLMRLNGLKKIIKKGYNLFKRKLARKNYGCSTNVG